MQQVTFIGFMGTGKSTIGQQVAKQLTYPFVDLDAVIAEQEGKSIADIFVQNGEDYFRKIESYALYKVLYRPIQQVIATGGGTVLNENNRKWIQARSYVVHLTATKETLAQRLQKGACRPLLQGDRNERIHHLLKQREAVYHFAHVTLSTDEGVPSQLATRIGKLVKQQLAVWK